MKFSVLKSSIEGALQNWCHPEFISGSAVEYLRIAFDDILGTDAETSSA
jgi:hypothetical protein